MLDLNLQEQVGKIKFQKVLNRPFKPLVSDLLQSPLANSEVYSRFIGSNFYYKNLIVSDGDIYDDLELVDAERTICENLFRANVAGIYQKSFDAEIYGKRLLKWSQNISANLEFTDIPYMLSEFLSHLKLIAPYLTFTLTIGEILESRLKNKLLQLFDDPTIIQENIAGLTSSDRPNIYTIERIALCKLAMKQKCNEDNVRNHLKLFASLGFKWGNGDNWNTLDIFERLSRIKNPHKELLSIQSYFIKIKHERNRIMSSLNLDNETKQLIKLANMYVWLRTYRTEVLNMSLGNISKLLNKNYIRRGYEKNDYLYFTQDEILADLRVTHNELANRKVSYSLLYLNGKKHLLSGDDSMQLHNSFYNYMISSRTLKGSVTFKSNNTSCGKAIVVKTFSDLSSISKGDIVVSSMTTPNFIPFLKKVSGIVTDEGGILCHASIISREMNIPCIVGTQIATEAIKSGDYITMNLSNGHVYVPLSRSHPL